MPEFLVQMDVAFPVRMDDDERRALLAEEGRACAPYLDDGRFVRAWRSYGEHVGSHGHVALWDTPSAADVAAAYATFPLVRRGIAVNFTITPLHDNPNDRVSRQRAAAARMWAGYKQIPLTWDSLVRLFDLNSPARTHHGEMPALAPVADGVTVHMHPESGNPRVIHFMVGDEKIAEIGPSRPAPDGMREDNVPGYVSILAEWDGHVIGHGEWKHQILLDNKIVAR